MSSEDGIRWIYVALFGATGVAAIAFRNRRFPRRAIIPDRAGGTVRARLESALARRPETPATPIAAAVTGAGLMGAAVAAFLRFPLAALVAFFYLAVGAGLTVRCAHAYAAGGRRGVSLRKRTPFRDGPWPLYALPFAQALAALPLVPALPLTLPLAIAITLGLLAIAWRTAIAPARIAGIDPEAELFVERRLRALRLRQILTIAPMPLLGVEVYGGRHGAEALPLVITTLVSAVAVTAWYFTVAVPELLRPEPPSLSADG